MVHQAYSNTAPIYAVGRDLLKALQQLRNTEVLRNVRSNFSTSMIIFTLPPMDIYLQNSSVVFAVGAQTPFLFAPEDLKDQQVIKESQSITDSLNMPFGSRVLYGEGYMFEAILGRALIQKEYYGEGILSLSSFSTLPDDIEESALNLAEMLKVLSLESVGVNFTLVVASGSLENLACNLLEEARTEVVGFSVPYGSFVTNYTLSRAQKEDPPSEGVLVDINFSGLVTDRATINSRLKQVKNLVFERNDCLRRAREVLNDLPL